MTDLPLLALLETGYNDNKCGGLTAPPTTSASGFTCQGYVFGDWCYDGREMVGTANLAKPTCQQPASGVWKCIAPCAYGGKSSIFVTSGTGGAIRCAGTGGDCRWYGNANCDGLGAPPPANLAAGFGCQGYVVGDWCYGGTHYLLY